MAYLERCRNAVLENGVIVVKENITETKDDMYDEIDSSVTRSASPKPRGVFFVCLLRFNKRCEQDGQQVPCIIQAGGIANP